MTQASILVVEDEHIVAKDIAARLTRRGYIGRRHRFDGGGGHRRKPDGTGPTSC